MKDPMEMWIWFFGGLIVLAVLAVIALAIWFFL